MADNQISKDLVPQELLDRLDALIEKIGQLWDVSKQGVTQEQEAIKSKQTLAEQMDALREKDEELIKLAKQYEDQQAKLSEETIKYNATQAEAVKIAKANAVINDANAGHIKKLTAEMQLLIIQRNNLNKADANYSQTVNELNSKLNKLGQEHKNLMSTREQDKINVGNYQSGIVGLIPGLDGVIGKLQAVGKSTVDGFKNAGMQVVSFAKSFQTAGGAAEAFGAITKAAMISTGIGAIVVAIAALYSYFTQTAEGAKILREAGAALGAVLNVIVGLLGKLGGLIVDVFTHPVESIKKLGQFIEDQIMNRLKSFAVMGKALVEIFSGKMKEGFHDLANGALQFETGVTNVIEKLKKLKDDAMALAKEIARARAEAMRISDMEYALVQKKRNMMVEEAKDEQAVLKLREISYDKTKTEQERIDALTKALQLEGKIAEDQKNLRVAGYNILMAKAAEKQRKGLKLGEDEKDAIAEAQKSIIDAESERIQKSLRMEKQLLALKQEMANEAKRLAEEMANEAKRLAEEEKKREEDKINFIEGLELGEAKSEEEKLKIEYDKKLEEAKKLGVDKLEVDKWYDAELDKIYAKEDKEVEAQVKKQIEAAQKIHDEKIKNIEDIAKIEAKSAKATMSVINQLADNQITKIKSTLKAQEAALDTERKTRIANGENAMQVDADIAAKKQKLDQDAAIKEAEIKRKQAIMDKLLGVFEIGILTAEAIMRAKTTPGRILAAILGATEEAAVLAKPLPAIPKFKGGVKGFSGGMAILHGGELINTPNESFFTKGGINDPIPVILPTGTDVIPNSVIMNDLRRLTMQANLTGGDEDIKAIRELAAAYRDKQETHVNINEHGFKIWQKQAMSQIQFMGRYRK